MSIDYKLTGMSDPICPHCFEVAVDSFDIRMSDTESRVIQCRKCDKPLLVEAFIYYNTKETT